MKLIVAALVTAALCVGTGLYADEGGGRGGGHRSGGRYGGGYRGGYHGGRHGAYNDGSDSGGGGGGRGHTRSYPRLMLRIIPGRELASTPASSTWLYVEPVSEEAVKRQEARDRNFAAAVADWEARNGRKIYEE